MTAADPVAGSPGTSADSSPAGGGARPAARQELEVVPVRHPGRVVSAVLVVALLVLLGVKLGTIDAIHYGDITGYLFKGSIVHGVGTTLELAVLSQLIGVVLGVVLAVMRLSKNPVLSSVSWLYIWFFRGTPLLVQVLFWFNGLPLVLPKHVHLGVGPVVVYDGATVDLITIFVAGLLALALNEGAYMAEIVRAGILAVDEGQTEAAHALGMTPLLGRADAYSSQNGEVFELLVMASLWYLAMTSLAYVGQYYLERRFARGSVRELPPTPLQRVRRTLSRGAPARPAALSTRTTA